MNPTGIKPVEFKVLVKVDDVADRSSGGIFLPEHTLEREQMGHDRGILVEKGDMAFDGWKGRVPEVGDKVIFNKYAGSVIQYRGENGMERYRLCKEEDIGAVILEE